jgi:hypothetical protein
MTKKEQENKIINKLKELDKELAKLGTIMAIGGSDGTVPEFFIHVDIETKNKKFLSYDLSIDKYLPENSMLRRFATNAFIAGKVARSFQFRKLLFVKDIDETC